MSVLILPIDSGDPYYAVDVDLDEAQYTFRVNYNFREEAWFFDLLNADKETVIAGRRLVVGGSLLNGFVSVDRPPGWLIALDTSNQDLDPGENDLGTRVIVCYVPLQDLIDAGLV